jgi:phosphonate degradation associated HDIG domain protein
VARAENEGGQGVSISDICMLFARKGGRAYEGEGVTQLEHALQTAAQAEAIGSPPALIAAALLHDLGHLLNDQGETPTLRGVDDLHQFVALPFLRPLYGDDVLEPIRMHVDAKRYLCATRADYYTALSADSKRSLVLQGGVYSADEASRFVEQPHAEDAVKIRVWDDLAKSPGAVTPPLAHFVAALEAAQRVAA